MVATRDIVTERRRRRADTANTADETTTTMKAKTTMKATTKMKSTTTTTTNSTLVHAKAAEAAPAPAPPAKTDSPQRCCWRKTMAAIDLVDSLTTTQSQSQPESQKNHHKSPQQQVINYKNRQQQQHSCGKAGRRRQEPTTSTAHVVSKRTAAAKEVRTMATLAELLKLCAYTLIFYCLVVNGPHAAFARKPSSQELNDYEEGETSVVDLEVQKRSEKMTMGAMVRQEVAEAEIEAEANGDGEGEQADDFDGEEGGTVGAVAVGGGGSGGSAGNAVVTDAGSVGAQTARNASAPNSTSGGGNEQHKSTAAEATAAEATTIADSPPRFKNPRNLPNIHSKPSGSYVQLSCPAFGHPEPNITWTRNDTKIYRHMGRVKKSKWSINMEDLVPEDSGVYKCRVCNYLGCIEHATKLIISDRVNHKPIILKAPANLTLPLNGSGSMECVFLSDLHSKKTWTFTPCTRQNACSTNYTFLKHADDLDILNFTRVTPQHEGWYTCIEMNGLGRSYSRAYLQVQDPSMRAVAKIIRGYEIWGIVAVMVLLTLVCIIFFVYVLRKVKHEKLLKQRIETVHQWTKKVIIYKPPSGDSSGSMDTMIMPVVKIEKQRTTVLQSSNCEPVPFNEYEFPLDSNWEIPRSQLILGSTLGEGAFGRVVMAEVNNSIVAVKMVKEGHTDDDIASLVREMEVMKIIGKHINIINLLGCCSQSGPLYVIVEFAPHGNLKDFLNKNRPLAAGQLKDYGEQQHQLPLPKHHLTEKHLISFAFQIARGMEYLASRRCIHRDLAARNVLVSDDYVMKIADFGLARDIQDTDYYRKNTNGRLPIKWMAPESLQDKFYDSQSDVWSYGILLWEIMTFGAQPYPTIMSAEELYSYLMSGQRMEKPAKCSLNIYMLMRQCWHFDASARPTFAEIVENLDKLLLANEDYLDVAVANLETPPSSSDEEESDVETLRYHYK